MVVIPFYLSLPAYECQRGAVSQKIYATVSFSVVLRFFQHDGLATGDGSAGHQ